MSPARLACLALFAGGKGLIPVLCCVSAVCAEEAAESAAHVEKVAPFVAQYCLDCHNRDDKVGGLDLQTPEIGRDPPAHAVWEKAARRLRARQMPPLDAPRPDEGAYNSILAALEHWLDTAVEQQPDPGRTDTLRRLNRTEYQNAVRDLFSLQIDATTLLPRDESGHGFDNVAVGDLSPTLLDRYITAAQEISRLAVGGAQASPGGATIRIRADRTQEEHVEGLSFGTRGGIVVSHTFPLEGEYEIQVRLARDRNEHVEGLGESHELEILLDRLPLARFTVQPPQERSDHQDVDAHLKARFALSAGPHSVGVTFVKNHSSLLETKRQPYQARFNMHRHPRTSPAVFQVSILGPYSPQGPGDTPSRRRIFVRRPTDPSEEDACAREILAALIRRAYRRPATANDVERAWKFYLEGKVERGFEAGIERALSSVLVSPHFLLHIERDPPGIARHTAYRISDLELASRLSFFLWSSIPDDELLQAAIDGELSRPEVLRQQVQRMLLDERAKSLVTNFAGQWLYLRNLEAITPDLRLFPDFDDNLRQAFREETERFVASVFCEDRSVLELLRADYTFLNERLARHYGIPYVYGDHFRRVMLNDDPRRGGLLRQGSVLTVTSYATRTSPVIRGKWVLENLLGTPPPPPPPNVPVLKDNTVSSLLSVRERLAEHRANPACASCHHLIDPPGLSLENFDAVGRWRTKDAGQPVDASGGLPDGSQFQGVGGLEQALLARPDLLVGTLAEKLLTFALGRGVEPNDGPAIRRIVREARAADYRFSAIVHGIVTSAPFQMRRSQ